jgi:signal transduction histidine kinase
MNEINTILSSPLSAERSSDEKVRHQAGYFFHIPSFSQFIDSISDIILILNEERQIILANQPLFDRFKLDKSDVYGKRPGEALDCINAFNDHGGCGTAEFCRTCGAARAIHRCMKIESAAIEECRISRKKNLDNLDLRVKSVPIEASGERFILFVITDISNEKRRQALERIFFHDVLNLASNIQGITELLTLGYGQDRQKYEQMLLHSTDLLVKEINAHKLLTAAENGELTLNVSEINSGDILMDLAELYKDQKLARGRHIRIDEAALFAAFKSDKTLLMRVVGNMIKNALESSRPDETVTIGCKKHKDRVEFWVHNPGMMPLEVQLQIFQRSFSTKGRDRGLGTYSIKLLSERYLKGKVSFESSEETGTIFRACYPLSLDSPGSD